MESLILHHIHSCLLHQITDLVSDYGFMNFLFLSHLALKVTSEIGKIRGSNTRFCWQVCGFDRDDAVSHLNSSSPGCRGSNESWNGGARLSTDRRRGLPS